MNKRKNLSVWISGVVLVLFIIVFCVFYMADIFRETPTLNLDTAVGAWWWHKTDNDKYLDFAHANGVDEVYYCDSSFDESTTSFISSAKEKNIKVYALWGEKEWIEDSTSLNNLILEYRQYQGKNENAQFSGIHLDVEPHQFSDFNENETKRKEYLTKYVNFVKEIVKNNVDITFDFDIPFWLDDLITYEGVEKPVYQHIMDSANRVFVMSYRDTAERIVDVASEELEYAKTLNKQIFVSVEMKSSEGDNVSFQEESKEVLYEELNKLDTLINQDYGISIHHIETWQALKDFEWDFFK